jgi:hypothetical protein
LFFGSFSSTDDNLSVDFRVHNDEPGYGHADDMGGAFDHLPGLCGEMKV